MRQPSFRQYFQFSKRERTGVIVLLILIAFSWCFPVLLPYYSSTSQFTDTSGFTTAVTAFESQLATAITPARIYGKSGYTGGVVTGNNAPVLFYFDPNTLDAAGWGRLGVPERTIRTIHNYLSKGGRFRKKEALQKIYGLSPAMYQQLLPYVRIPATVHQVPERMDSITGIPRKVTYEVPARKLPALININTADTLIWQSLPGIGPVLSRRIVAFREKLGGFYAITQVAETYGLPDTTFNKIQPLLRLYDGSLTKIDINHSDEKSLADHPYIRYKLAGLIVRYRNAHGPFSRLEDLRAIPLVDEIIYRKIEHYIEIKL
jgi:competence protein ComEA